jgi:hypothetical protein
VAAVAEVVSVLAVVVASAVVVVFSYFVEASSNYSGFQEGKIYL